MTLPTLTYLTAQRGEKVEWVGEWGGDPESVEMTAAEDEVMVPLGVDMHELVVGKSASELVKIASDLDGAEKEQRENMMKERENMMKGWRTTTTSETHGWGTKVPHFLTKNAHILLVYLQAQDAAWGLEGVMWSEGQYEDVATREVNLTDLRVYGSLVPLENEEGRLPWDHVIFSRYNNRNPPANQQEWFSDDDTTIETPRDQITVYSELGKPPDVRLCEQLLMPSMSH